MVRGDVLVATPIVVAFVVLLFAGVVMNNERRAEERRESHRRSDARMASECPDTVGVRECIKGYYDDDRKHRRYLIEHLARLRAMGCPHYLDRRPLNMCETNEAKIEALPW